MEPKLTPTYADNVNGIQPIHSIGNGWEPQAYTLSSVQPAEAVQAIAPVAQPAPRKIAIIGTAPSSRDLAPYGDPSWEIWATSPGNMKIMPRVTRWYELHANLLWPECRSYGVPYLEWLSQQVKAGAFPGGLWMQDQRFIEEAKPFPMKELHQEFGPFFFSSSFSWCIAHAVSEGVQEIGLWGVDMASKDEYILQRPAGQFFIWECRKRGIKVTLPPESDLDQPPPLYAYSENTPFLRKILVREQELKARIAGMEQELSKAQGIQNQVTYLRGALEDLEYTRMVWGGVQHGMEYRDLPNTKQAEQTVI